MYSNNRLLKKFLLSFLRHNELLQDLGLGLLDYSRSRVYRSGSTVHYILLSFSLLSEGIRGNTLGQTIASRWRYCVHYDWLKIWWQTFSSLANCRQELTAL